MTIDFVDGFHPSLRPRFCPATRVGRSDGERSEPWSVAK